MKRPLLAWFFCACLLLSGGIFWWRTYQTIEIDDGFPAWPPDTEAIRRELDMRLPITDSGKNEDARRELFAELFKNRYRHHQPQIAVGMRFLSGNRIKLMCPARMEPWNIDRLAMTAWREARSLFGETFEIDLYETYIGASPHLIGKLRPLLDNPHKARISYEPNAFRNRTPYRTRLGASLGR